MASHNFPYWSWGSIEGWAITSYNFTDMQLITHGLNSMPAYLISAIEIDLWLFLTDIHG